MDISTWYLPFNPINIPMPFFTNFAAVQKIPPPHNMLPEYININDYDYPLPDERIARFPLEQRDATRLLVFRDGTPADSTFSMLDQHIPEKSLFVFNNTRVIRARLIFRKASGSRIEIFCLQPLGGYGQTGGITTWKCLVGNAKRWKSGPLEMTVDTGIGEVTLNARKGEMAGDAFEITFGWDKPEMPFEQVLEFAGKVPLPPYLNREPVESDTERYQTIYAEFNGSVAAPTAGLHFTPAVLEKLESRHCSFEYLTLHVGAGTFKPVSVEDARHHAMHEEELIIERQSILRLLQHNGGSIIPVGTTSMRSLESLYWLGVQLINGKDPGEEFFIDQWEPYRTKTSIPPAEALQAIYDYLTARQMNSISGFTRIMIAPGYRFRMCDALVTNFHQPRSTLLLLVAAFIGEGWKKAYMFALEHGYRFLSYGDSCLFFPEKEKG